jgi:protocatechuate 3,4-dioxygenase beta subunit
MTRQPRTEPLTYEGRVLPKQDEEVVDQGLVFDVTTLLGRRRVLQLLGVGAGTLTLAACTTATSGSGATTSGTATAGTTAEGEIPEETAGPYPGDGSNGANVLEESGVIRSDIRSSFGTGSATAAGVPMTLTLAVTDMAKDGAPFAGVAVYVWHCDRAGKYSLYSDGLKDENYLRGVQVADDAGKVRFTSIFPACYPGRWPHIHFEVYPDAKSITDSTTAIATSQVALPKAACDAVYAATGYDDSVKNFAQVSLANDNVFSDDGGKSQLATVRGSVAKGYAVSLTVPIDTRTDAGGGGAAPSGTDGQPAGAPSGGPGGAPRAS